MTRVLLAFSTQWAGLPRPVWALPLGHTSPDPCEIRSKWALVLKGSDTLWQLFNRSDRSILWSMTSFCDFQGLVDSPCCITITSTTWYSIADWSGGPFGQRWERHAKSHWHCQTCAYIRRCSRIMRASVQCRSSLPLWTSYIIYIYICIGRPGNFIMYIYICIQTTRNRATNEGLSIVVHLELCVLKVSICGCCVVDSHRIGFTELVPYDSIKFWEVLVTCLRKHYTIEYH
jgi:hypothetical protein